MSSSFPRVVLYQDEEEEEGGEREDREYREDRRIRERTQIIVRIAEKEALINSEIDNGYQHENFDLDENMNINALSRHSLPGMQFTDRLEYKQLMDSYQEKKRLLAIDGNDDNPRHLICHLVNKWDPEDVSDRFYGHNSNHVKSSMALNYNPPECPFTNMCDFDLSEQASLAAKYGSMERFGEVFRLATAKTDRTDYYSDPVFDKFYEDLDDNYFTSLMNGDVDGVIEIITRMYSEIMVHIDCMAKAKALPKAMEELTQRCDVLFEKYKILVWSTKYYYSIYMSSQPEMLYDAFWDLDANRTHLLAEPRPLLFAAIAFCLSRKVDVVSNISQGVYSSIPLMSRVPDILDNLLNKTWNAEGETVEQFSHGVMTIVSQLASFAWSMFGSGKEVKQYKNEMSVIASSVCGTKPGKTDYYRHMNISNEDVLVGKSLGVAVFIELCLKLHYGSNTNWAREILTDVNKYDDANNINNYLDLVERFLDESIETNDVDINEKRFFAYLRGLYRSHLDRHQASKSCQKMKVNLFINLLMDVVLKNMNNRDNDDTTNLYRMLFSDILDIYGENGRKLLFFGHFASLETISRKGVESRVKMNEKPKDFEKTLNTFYWNAHPKSLLWELRNAAERIQMNKKKNMEDIREINPNNSYTVLNEGNVIEARSNAAVAQIIASITKEPPHYEIVKIKEHYETVETEERAKKMKLNVENQTAIWSIPTDGDDWVNGDDEHFHRALLMDSDVRRVVMLYLLVEFLLGIPHTSSAMETFIFNKNTKQVVYRSKECALDHLRDNENSDIFALMMGNSDLGILLHMIATPPKKYSISNSTAFCRLLFDTDVLDMSVRDVLYPLLKSERFPTFINELQGIMDLFRTHTSDIIATIYRFGLVKNCYARAEIFFNKSMKKMDFNIGVLKGIPKLF